MIPSIQSLDGLRPNPNWGKLPLFDHKGWRRMPFSEFADSINERVEPSDAAEGIYVGLEHLDPQNLHIRRYRVNSFQATQFRIWATRTLKDPVIFPQCNQRAGVKTRHTRSGRAHRHP